MDQIRADVDLTPQQFCDAMTAVSIRNVELGSNPNKPQHEVALHLSGGRTIFIGTSIDGLYFSTSE
jgi:hypothetical protein